MFHYILALLFELKPWICCLAGLRTKSNKNWLPFNSGHSTGSWVGMTGRGIKDVPHNHSTGMS